MLIMQEYNRATSNTKKNRPVKSTGKSLIKETQKALRTHSVSKAKTACMTLIQKKKPLVIQRIYRLLNILNKLRRLQQGL